MSHTRLVGVLSFALALLQKVAASSFRLETMGMIVHSTLNSSEIDHRRPITNIKGIESCDIMQPNVTTRGDMVTSSQKFDAPKLSTLLYYDDEIFHIVIDKSGSLFISNLYSFSPGPQVWNSMTSVPDAIKIATKYAITKDKRSNSFPSKIISNDNPNATITGDVIFLLADSTIYALPINRSGIIFNAYMKSFATGLEKDKIDKLMAIDNNIILMTEKKILVFQYQSIKGIESKQHYPAFKDVEDVAITRVNGIRIFKVKASKAKFKVFSTLASSDWNPYIEGIGRKNLLDNKEYNEIELLEANYGNVVIKAVLGTNCKYFVVRYNLI